MRVPSSGSRPGRRLTARSPQGQGRLRRDLAELVDGSLMARVNTVFVRLSSASPRSSDQSCTDE